MKKFIVVFAALMVVAFAGTAMAVDYARNLNDGDYQTPIVSSGGSVWVLAGGTATNGATLFQINPVTGVSVYWPGNFNSGPNTLGATAYTAPAMVQRSGESGVTFVMQVKQTQDTAIGTGFTGGTSLYGLYFSPTNGAGATHFQTSLAHRRGLLGNNPLSGGSLFVGDAFISATSGWSTHLMIDEVNDPSGATVYGTSGVSVTAAGNGASIWAIGLYDGAGRGALNNNQWAATTQATRAVSGFYTPLAIAGNSLFAIGDWTYYGNTGVSLLMFDKRKLQAGPNAAATLGVNPTTGGTTLFTTPAIAGNSLFVLDSRGGLTAYSIASNNILPTARVAGDFTQLGATTGTSVIASPVTDGTFLVTAVNHLPSGVAGVTVFRIDNKRIAGASGTSWWYEWTAGTTIAATPVISNGNVYVAVNSANNGAVFYRFSLNKSTHGRVTATDQNWSSDANSVNFGMIETGGMIIADNRLIAISNHAGQKRLYSISVADSASSNSYWRMFKFDVSRTGANTYTPSTPTLPGSSGGCFISTVK